MELSFGQGRALIAAQKVQGALRNTVLTEALAGLWPCCTNSDIQSPFPSWGSSGRQAQKDLFLLSQNCTSLFFPLSVLSKSRSQSLDQTLVPCRAVCPSGNAASPAQLLKMLLEKSFMTFRLLPTQKCPADSITWPGPSQHPHSSSTSPNFGPEPHNWQLKHRQNSEVEKAAPTTSHPAPQTPGAGQSQLSAHLVPNARAVMGTTQAGHILPLI